jgi:predicted transcriptional regulator
MASQKKEEIAMTKIVTPVHLDEDVRTRLKKLAAEERVSMAVLIRRAIDQYLRAQPRRKAVKR